MNDAIQALRQKLQQLQSLHESGAVGQQAYDDARRSLEAELVSAVMSGSDVPAPRASRRLQAGLCLAILALAVAGYAWTGSPAQVSAQRPSAAVAATPTDGSTGPTAEQMAEVVDRMAQQLKDKPDDATGWTLLARAYSAMGRYTDAVPAFRKALSLAGESAPLLADYADVLAAQNNGKLSEEAIRQVERALVLEPANVKALALSGSAAFDKNDFAGAVRQWEKVERILPPDSPFMADVRASIAQARQAGGLPAAAATAQGAGPRSSSPSPPAAQPGGVASTGRVSGSVSLAASLAAKASPEDTVFVVARAAEGPRMPLAVLRKQVKDLPLEFTLDDSMAMAPGARISDHPRLVVIARISKSGDALPRPGDLAGRSAEVAPGATSIVIQIADVVAQ